MMTFKQKKDLVFTLYWNADLKQKDANYFITWNNFTSEG